MQTTGNIFDRIRQGMRRRAALREQVDPEREARLVEFYRERLRAWGYDERSTQVSLRLAQLLARLFTGTAGKGIMMQGVPGSGKTAGMRLVAEYLAMRWYEAEHLQGLGAGARWEARGGPRAVTQFEWQRPLDVVLDDLGAEETLVDYGNRLEPVGQFLAERYRLYCADGRLTHVTTNLDDAALSARYGERLTSRLHEMCSAVDCGKRDWRKEA